MCNDTINILGSCRLSSLAKSFFLLLHLKKMINARKQNVCSYDKVSMLDGYFCNTQTIHLGWNGIIGIKKI